MHVILVGGGIGGLAAALSLSARGASVTLVERTAAFAEAGAGLQLSPNATRLLFELGLETGLRAIAFAPEAIEVRARGGGARLLRTELGAQAERRWGAPYLQVHRADLQALLVQAVNARPQIRLRLGENLIGLAQDATGVTAKLRPQASTGANTERADVLIGCDGVRSTVREALWGATPARFTGHTAWRSLVAAGRFDAAAWTRQATVWTGFRRHFVHYPVRGGALINLVGVVEQRCWSGESWAAEGDPAELVADFAHWPEPVAALTAAASRTWRYALHDRPALARWSAGRASLLGDAAHPAPPFLAQGAAMAIEDAEALARHLSAPGPIVGRLMAYEAERRPRTARVQAWSRRNARLFHLPAAVAAPLFAAAAITAHLDGSDGSRRLDWLYGYRPPA